MSDIYFLMLCLHFRVLIHTHFFNYSSYLICCIVFFLVIRVCASLKLAELGWFIARVSYRVSILSVHLLKLYDGLICGLSFTQTSILRSVMTAMEELELHVHITTVKSYHAHMCLYIIREQQKNDLVPHS